MLLVYVKKMCVCILVFVYACIDGAYACLYDVRTLVFVSLYVHLYVYSVCVLCVSMWVCISLCSVSVFTYVFAYVCVCNDLYM